MTRSDTSAAHTSRTQLNASVVKIENHLLDTYSGLMFLFDGVVTNRFVTHLVAQILQLSILKRRSVACISIQLRNVSRFFYAAHAGLKKLTKDLKNLKITLD